MIGLTISPDVLTTSPAPVELVSAPVRNAVPAQQLGFGEGIPCRRSCAGKDQNMSNIRGIFRTCPLMLVLLAALLLLQVFGIARAATPPAFAMGPGDSWNGVHSFLVFAPEPEGDFAPAHIAAIARRYDFGWSPRHVKNLIAGNPAFVTGVYYTSTQVDRDKKWIDANHPEWIVYKGDRTTPVTQFDYKALTFDISNPEVVAYQFESMKKLANTPRMAVAWDNCYLDNSLGAVGVRGKDGKWVQKFLGKGSYAEVYDPAWTDAVIEQLRVVHDRLHALRPYPILLVPNADVKIVSGDPVRSAKFIEAVDGVLIEGGYFGPHYVGDPRRLWLRGLRFVERMQAAGKTYYSIEVPPNGQPVTRDYLQFTLASYLLAKGHTARILLARPTKSGYDSGNPDACWYPEFDAPIGTPLGPMRQVAGDRDTENGVYLREHSGGVSIVNASQKNSFTVALPDGSSYMDLYGKSAGTTVTVPPVTGLVLLRKGAAKTEEAAPSGLRIGAMKATF